MPTFCSAGSIRRTLPAAQSALEPRLAQEALQRDVGETLGAGCADGGLWASRRSWTRTWPTPARVHAVENGQDIADYTMIAFGGAGPLHAARLCEKLGIRRFLVPPGAGVGSAIGFLRAPFGFEAARSAFMRLSEFDAESVNRLLESLTEEASRLRPPGAGATGSRNCERTAYMRYAGQGWEIPVDVAVQRRFADGDRASLKEQLRSRLSPLLRPPDRRAGCRDRQLVGEGQLPAAAG